MQLRYRYSEMPENVWNRLTALVYTWPRKIKSCIDCILNSQRISKLRTKFQIVQTQYSLVNNKYNYPKTEGGKKSTDDTVGPIKVIINKCHS